MLENAAESPASGARFVGHFTERKTHCLKKDTTTNQVELLHTAQILTTA
jgi:hypothetical protein